MIKPFVYKNIGYSLREDGGFDRYDMDLFNFSDSLYKTKHGWFVSLNCSTGISRGVFFDTPEGAVAYWEMVRDVR